MKLKDYVEQFISPIVKKECKYSIEEITESEFEELYNLIKSGEIMRMCKNIFWTSGFYDEIRKFEKISWA